jgi:hypothetical protein
MAQGLVAGIGQAASALLSGEPSPGTIGLAAAGRRMMTA